MVSGSTAPEFWLLSGQKLVAAGAIVALSLVFGLLPQTLAKRSSQLTPSSSVLSFLTDLGGGVLLANCFCHWLPEVREGLQHTALNRALPVAEVTMCLGFLAVMAVEEAVHRLHAEDGSGQSLVRTVYVLLALSFHSCVEGLALALEDSSAGVWLNTVATSLHKFVIAFSLGVELLTSGVQTARFHISIAIFSLAPVIGCLLGLLIQYVTEEGCVDIQYLQILQGLATGTIVYIIFFEIFPKALKIGGPGFQHVLAISLGFTLFLPSLYFHSGHDEKENGQQQCGNLTAQ